MVVLLAAKPASQRVQLAAQFPPQPIDRLQGKRQPQGFGGGLERQAA